MLRDGHVWLRFISAKSHPLHLFDVIKTEVDHYLELATAPLPNFDYHTYLTPVY